MTRAAEADPAHVSGPAPSGQKLFTDEESRSLVRRSTLRGVLYCLVDVAVLAALLAGALLAEHLLVQLVLSVAAGVMIGVLFVVGHDAAHQSLTDSRTMNYVLGQVALLPALHPFSFWVKVHNQTHHRWTNLSPQDYVWTPLSREGYERLTPWGRAAYRFYRGPLGPLGYYLIEFWGRRIFMPSAAENGRYTKPQVKDTAVVLAAAVAYAAFLGAGGGGEWFGAGKAWWNAPLFGFVVPFFVWNTLMSLVIYLHHTHPELTWYDDQAEWKRDASQLESSVHVIFPGPINGFFHWIMEHSAHHVRPAIPLYHLPEAQRIIEERAPGRVIVFRWTVAGHLEVVRRCKLYDYRAKRWMDFAGSYTT